MRGRAWLLAFALLFLAGCGDKTIALTYAPAPPALPLTGTRAITVFAFRDARGEEGDGSPYRGDLKNFSTEARYTNSAHISAIVRLYESNGTITVEKEISQRVLTSVDDLQRIMNDALSQFVQRVVTDPDIAARLVGDKRPE